MWEYVTLFVLAATPLLEVLVVIPLGIGYGLDPMAVAIVAVVGNALPIAAIAAAFGRWRRWRQVRSPAGATGLNAGASVSADADIEPAAPPQPTSGRRRRAQRLWERYGMPGLALLAPLVTGVHLAAIVALALGSSRRAVAGWMIGSVVLWAIGVTVLSVAGFEAVRPLWS